MSSALQAAAELRQASEDEAARKLGGLRKQEADLRRALKLLDGPLSAAHQKPP
jgi:hypothetical protein